MTLPRLLPTLVNGVTLQRTMTVPVLAADGTVTRYALGWLLTNTIAVRLC